MPRVASMVRGTQTLRKSSARKSCSDSPKSSDAISMDVALSASRDSRSSTKQSLLKAVTARASSIVIETNALVGEIVATTNDAMDISEQLETSGLETSDLGHHKRAEVSQRTHTKDQEEGYHKAYFWVQTEVGLESANIDPIVVVEQHGIPAEIVLHFLREQVDGQSKFFNLPGAMLLLISFSFLSVHHLHAPSVFGMKAAVDFDMRENANFAFDSTGTMGHKALQDVNSYADFWSWMRQGLLPLLHKMNRPVSETPPLVDLGELNYLDRQFYLWQNRRIGALELRQSQRKPGSQCGSSEESIFGRRCQAPSDLRDFKRPESYDVVTANFEVATDKTVLFHFNETYGAEGLQKQALQLEADFWLNPDTEQVMLRFLTFNAPLDIVTLSSIHLIFTRSGRIWQDITYVTTVLSAHHNFWAVFFDVLFYGQIIWILFIESCEAAKAWCRHGAGFVVLYVNFWNLVDWLTVIWGFMTFGFWVVQLLHKREMRDALSSLEYCFRSPSSMMPTIECDRQSLAMFGLMDDITPAMLVNRAMSAVYTIIIMMRLFKAFSGQPRMAVITNTLVLAWKDVYHFAIVFLSIFGSFAVVGLVLFGREVKEFVTLGEAIFACTRMLFGDFALIEDMKQVGESWTIIFFGTFNVTFAFVLLNMLIAILMEALGQASSGRGNTSETVVEQVVLCLRRVIQTLLRQRVTLVKIVRSLNAKLDDGTVGEATLLRRKNFQDLVPGLEEMQASRLLLGAASFYANITQEEPGTGDIMKAWADVTSKMKEAAGRFWLQDEEWKSLRPRLQVIRRKIALSRKLRHGGRYSVEVLAKEVPMKTLLQAAKLRLEADYSADTTTNTVVLRHQLLAAKASYSHLEGVLQDRTRFRV